jgi:hypothetical protein
MESQETKRKGKLKSAQDKAWSERFEHNYSEKGKSNEEV